MSELLFASSDSREAYRISRMLREKKIRKIAPRIYTTNFEETPGEIIRRNILEILGHLYPGAVLSHRSAFEFKPTSADQIFVTHSYRRKIKLPGITINFLEGKGPVEGDNKMFGDLYVSSKQRAFLENLQVTKKAGPNSKSLSLPEIEEKLDDIAKVHGEEGLNRLRDSARKISSDLNMGEEFKRLDRIIGAMLSTKPANVLKSPLAISRATGSPFDKHRLDTFEKLFNYLHNKEFPSIPENNLSINSFRNFAFFEAYFSNYIEGTEFEVEEAKRIVDTGAPLPSRGEDSHDILGTYQIVSDRKEMSKVPSSPDDFLDLLKTRHAVLLFSRKGKSPGEFKEKNNRAGNTHFVDYRLVRGTLIRAFEFFRVLSAPFARAAFMKFLISEVHPFNDGNGRIARVMMNAELVNAKSAKIIIPTVYRDDYLLTLKRLTNQKDPVPYVDMLSKVRQFSAKLSFESYEDLYSYLEEHNAFFEPDQDRHLQFD